MYFLSKSSYTVETIEYIWTVSFLCKFAMCRFRLYKYVREVSAHVLLNMLTAETIIECIHSKPTKIKFLLVH